MTSSRVPAPTGPEPATAEPRRALGTAAQRWLAVATGLVTAIVALGAAEVVAAVLGAQSPFLDVAGLVIDLSPPWLKEAVIGAVGTADKVVIAVSLVVVLALLAAAVGLLERRRPPLGGILLGIVVIIAAIASATRADAVQLAIVPVLVGGVLGELVLRALDRRLKDWAAPLSRAESLAQRPRAFERRRFLRFAVAGAALAAVGGGVARAWTSAAQAARAARESLRLPAPVSTAEPVPASAELQVDGILPWQTPNDDFYRIDIALQVPSIAPADWRLRIHGMVENEIELTWDDITALPLEEHWTTLACVSNEVGGDLIGNAKWLGYPIRELLARAKPTAEADMVLSSASDGFSAGTPLEVLQDADRAAILAIGMNGEPLPIEHGFPARLVVPGLYGYVSATKWVTDIELTTYAKAEGYWTPRGWSAKGPVKLSSRIDTPTSSADAGAVTVAGVAWAQHTGVSKVEVQVDDGAWAEAELARVVTVDSWLQWRYRWAASSGSHTLRVRATDTDGRLQVEADAPPAPNGSTGYHEVSVQVA